MSNFKTFTNAVGGQPGDAPVIFSGSTEDSAATLAGTGYMNDREDQVKVNDLIWIVHDIISTPPGIITLYRVVLVGSDLNLVFVLTAP
jgi:hypothetical protein